MGSCQGTNDSRDYITSPNYPQNYEKNLDCRWLITVPVENIVTLTFDDFMTWPGHDELFVYDGAIIKGQPIKRLTGAGDPLGSGTGSKPNLISSTKNEMYLRFTTREGRSRGFKIKIGSVGKYTYHIYIQMQSID